MQREELPFDLDLGQFQRWWNPFNLSHDEKINTIKLAHRSVSILTSEAVSGPTTQYLLPSHFQLSFHIPSKRLCGEVPTKKSAKLSLSRVKLLIVLC